MSHAGRLLRRFGALNVKGKHLLPNCAAQCALIEREDQGFSVRWICGNDTPTKTALGLVGCEGGSSCNSLRNCTRSAAFICSTWTVVRPVEANPTISASWSAKCVSHTSRRGMKQHDNGSRLRVNASQ